MARRSGVLVQIQREMARRSREAERARAAHYRAQVQAHRAAEAANRAAVRQANADARQQKALYMEARAAQVAAMNADLNARVGDLRELLSHTLEVDDHIDLESLRRVVEHPPLVLGELGNSIPEPRWNPPRPPGAVSRLFGGAKRHETKTATAWSHYQQGVQWWQQREAERLAAVEAAQARYQEECRAREEDVSRSNAELDSLIAGCEAGRPEAVLEYFGMVLANSLYPDDFPQRYKLAYVPESQQLVVEYDLPTLEVVPQVREYRYVKTKDEVVSSARTVKDRKDLYASIIAQVALRTIHESFEADRSAWIETVVFNGMVSTTDPATGRAVRPCLVSLRTTRAVFSEIELDRVDPIACLAHLNASVSKRPEELRAIRPVIEFNMVDRRFAEETDVLSELDARPNLLELTPYEFEALIQNLFAKMGLETKQTRASRDGGIDCIAFDPRPIFGGKVVIQAKRYKNTVDVSAVRDLFGSMQNEGASKGILVTTSGYGPTSYEFASGKPMELIDGSNLLYLLAEHTGLEARILPLDAPS